MKSFYISLTAALDAAAQGCETTSTVDPEAGDKILRLTSPDQIAVFDGCTTIADQIVIEPGYLGQSLCRSLSMYRA
ncbi:hypothetical protein BDV12DRAFT_198908 [Aspergillus spectabilis]